MMNLKTNKRRVFQIKDKGSFVDIVYSPYSKKMYALYKYGVFAEIDKNMNKVKEWKLGDEIRKAMGSGRGGRNSKVWLEVSGKKVLFRIDQERRQLGDNRIPAKTIDVDGIAFDVKSEKFNSFLFN